MKRGSKSELLSIISTSYAHFIEQKDGLLALNSVCNWELPSSCKVKDNHLVDHDYSGACHYYAKPLFKVAELVNFTGDSFIVTSLGVRPSYVTSCDDAAATAIIQASIRWFKFILDKRISPWRRYLKLANPVVYYMNSVNKQLPTHVKLDMSAANTYCDLGYNFLVATRFCVDRRFQLEDWVWYMDVKGMSPADALYMCTRYKPSRLDRNTEHVTYHVVQNGAQHPINSGANGCLLSALRSPPDLKHGSLFCYNKRLWCPDVSKSVPLSYEGIKRSPIFKSMPMSKTVSTKGVQDEIDAINKSRKVMSK